MSMVKVVTGNDKLKFKCQGQKATHNRPIRVKLTHDVAMKLRVGSLKLYTEEPPKPAPKPKPEVVEVIKEPVIEKKKKNSNKGDK